MRFHHFITNLAHLFLDVMRVMYGGEISFNSLMPSTLGPDTVRRHT
jgi:hypothetical protein